MPPPMVPAPRSAVASIVPGSASDSIPRSFFARSLRKKRGIRFFDTSPGRSTFTRSRSRASERLFEVLPFSTTSRIAKGAG